MVNYNEGKIYKIICNLTNEIYIGSTCKPLARRLVEHICGFKRWKNGKGDNVKSFQIIERDDYSIVLIENVNCETKEQLLRRERFHIETNACINKCVPLRTLAEYRYEHKEFIVEQKKEYYLDNKEKLNEKIICECGGKYTHTHKAHHYKTIRHSIYQEKLNEL